MFCRQRPPGRKFVQRFFYCRQGDARTFRNFDDCNAAKRIACIATLVTGAPLPMNQALRLIEVDGRDSDATSAGEFSHRKWDAHINHE